MVEMVHFGRVIPPDNYLTGMIMLPAWCNLTPPTLSPWTQWTHFLDSLSPQKSGFWVDVLYECPLTWNQPGGWRESIGASTSSMKGNLFFIEGPQLNHLNDKLVLRLLGYRPRSKISGPILVDASNIQIILGWFLQIGNQIFTDKENH